LIFSQGLDPVFDRLVCSFEPAAPAICAKARMRSSMLCFFLRRKGGPERQRRSRHIMDFTVNAILALGRAES